MTPLNRNTSAQKKRVKAVGLISGGLDSLLAAKIIKDLGADVHGIHFSMPWDYCKANMASEGALQIGIKLINLQLDDQYLKIVKKPKHGYGTAINPCVDCHIYMLKRAAAYMNEIQADFIFTGEVLGQRPMSQKRHSLKWVEKESGLEGKLLRPLSAQSLDATIPEKEGIIDRTKLLDIIGRSRRAQIRLAEDLHVTKSNQPAGGCLLTDRNFAKRMQDTFDHGYKNFRETITLQWGRHFRINDGCKAIVGRDQKENDSLTRYAHPDDHVMLFAQEEKAGPTVLLKGDHPSDEVLSTAAGLVQQFSKYKDAAPMEIQYWPANDRGRVRHVTARKLNLSEIEQMYI